MDWLNSLFVLPYSMLAVFLANICIALVCTLIFRFIVDVKRLETGKLEISRHKRKLKEADYKNDKVAKRRLKRGEICIKRLPASVSKQRFKVITVTVLPFITVFLLLNMFYNGGADCTFSL